jgi:hypothetical protein
MILEAAVALAIVAQSPQAPRDLPRPGAPGTGVLSGRVVDADTRTPVRRAVVRLTSPRLPRRLTARADLSGRFAFTDLPEGQYTLTAGKAGYLTLEFGQRRPFEPGRRLQVNAGQKLTGVDVALPRAGAIVGTVTDNQGDPIDQMWVSAMRPTYVDGRRVLRAVDTTVTNDVGAFRLNGLAPGDYYVKASDRLGPVEFAEEPLVSPTTYYPGVTDVAQAERVAVKLGAEVRNLALVVTPAPSATLTGSVVRADGGPVRLFSGRVSLQNTTESGIGGGITGGASIGEGGAFRLSGVRPDSYQLLADVGTDFGILPIDVGGGDMSVNITVGRGGSIKARIVTADGAPLPQGTLEFAARPVGDPWHGRGTANAAARDGSVSWNEIFGRKIIRGARLPNGWMLTRVLRGNTDITDTPFDITHDERIDDIVITVDRIETRVTGTVVGEKGARIQDYTAIIFAEDAQRWTPHTRWIAAARPDHEGTFVIEGMPPGEYRVAAVDFVENGQWFDPGYLESIRDRTRTIIIEPNKPLTLTLSLSVF